MKLETSIAAVLCATLCTAAVKPDPVLSGRAPADAPAAASANLVASPAAASANPANLAAAPAAASTNLVASPPRGRSTPARDSIITAERTDYDRKNGVILFDRNVHVDDEQFQMYSDRLWVFLKGTNELSRIVAIGNVSLTNGTKSAFCARATYSKETARVVMFAESKEKPARLSDNSGKGEMVVRGRKITFYIDDDRVAVEDPVVSAPNSALGSSQAKALLKREDPAKQTKQEKDPAAPAEAK